MTQTVADRLRWARINSGYTENDVACALGLSSVEIRSIESGSRSLRSEEIERFAGLYDFRADWLVRGSDSFEATPQVEVAARALQSLSSDDLTAVLTLIQALNPDHPNA